MGRKPKYKTEADRQAAKRRQALAVFQRRIQAGMCRRCNRNRLTPADGNECPTCARRSADEGKRRRDARKAAGCCASCDDPTAAGDSLCGRHRAMQREADRRFRETHRQGDRHDAG